MKTPRTRRLQPWPFLLLAMGAFVSSCRSAESGSDAGPGAPASVSAPSAQARPLRAADAGPGQPVTIFHTNDLHGHFRSEKTPLKSGGLARLKTLVDGLRRQSPNSLLVDGGDWSEGTLYYTQGGGAENLKLMDYVGYDVAVVGNHDWLNGPGKLLDAVETASPRLALVGANLEFPGYSRANEFRKHITPYVIKQVNGARIAFVGLVNSDPTYGGYLEPLKVSEPGAAAARLATQLKQSGVDAVIAISHNSVDANREILKAAPDLDLIVGAHDHARLVHPVPVARPGQPDAWIVEAGSWGRYVGRLDLEVVRGGVVPKGYRLYQVDRKTPEDSGVTVRLDELEGRIEAQLGPVFHDQVAESGVELYRTGVDSIIGDFTTDAYRAAVGTDVALEQNNFIYGELHEGPLSSADFFEANPPIYSPETGKSWTLHTWKMSGLAATQVFNLMYLWRKTTASGGFSFSGMELVYDPSLMKDNIGPGDAFGGLFGGTPKALRTILIGGKPVDPKRAYSFVASQGVVEIIKTINKKFYGFIPLNDLRDTGVEDWRAMADHARRLSAAGPMRATDVPGMGLRIRTWQPDLGVVYDEMRWDPVTRVAQVTVRNFGATASRAASIELLSLKTGTSYDLDVEEQGLSLPLQTIPELAPGAGWTFTWSDVHLTEDAGLYSLVASIRFPQGEDFSRYNWSNDRVTRIFSAKLGK